MIETEDLEVSGTYLTTMTRTTCLVRPKVNVALAVLALDHLRTSSRTLSRRTSMMKMDSNKTMTMSMFFENLAEI